MDSEALRIAYGRERPQSRLGEESLHSTVSKALSFARERESSESLLGQEQSRRTISEASRRFPLQPHRSISDALRLARERLGEEESLAEQDGYYGLARFPSNLHADLPVYKIIHRIRRLIVFSIDDPYTLEQLLSPRITVSIVRPLVDRLYDPDNISIVFCLLVNRVEFLRGLQSYQPTQQTVESTRATLCELLATRVLRRFEEDNPGRHGLLLLANILISNFRTFQNAPEEVIVETAYTLRGDFEMATNVWQLAIISESKLFLSSNPFQRVVESVYYGRVVYTPNSWFAIIPENYKRGGISLYDPRKASILNQNRLIVPRTRHIIEVCQYIILIMLYVMTMINRNYGQFTGWEVAFLTYTAGWCLNEFASTLEHGWHVHTRNLWSYLDMLFITIYCTYFVIRMHGRAIRNDKEARQALDILACAAPILFSRIAFNLMPENILFLTLRAMVRDFFGFMLITVWCCSGFLVSLLWLSQWEAPEPKSEPPSFFTITEWMLWIFFGLDGTGISRSVDIHRILGPTLMITFALLGNILFFAIIVSMLGNTFSRVVSSANMEIQFRHAVLTYEGVKSDGIFAYRPPFNLLAPFVLLPLKFILSPRWFHKVHVTTVRVLNAPILLCVNYYERRRLWKHKFVKRVARKSVFNFSQFSVQGNVQAVFSVEPPREMADELEEEDILDGDILDLGFRGKLSVGD